MRYQARWSNGSWKVFDRSRFEDVEPCVSQKLADIRAAELNTQRRK